MTISVKMGNQEERETAKKMSHEELRRKLGVQQFKAVQKLPSGDLKVILHREGEKSRLEKDQSWLKAAYPEAQVEVPSTQVIVHSIRTSWKPEDANSWVQLDQDNLTWFPDGLKIRKAFWLKNQRAREETNFSSVVMAVQDKQTAREMCKRGITIGSMWCVVEPYHPQQRIVQCLKCNNFGHITTHCRATEDTCGKCAGKHRTDQCKEKRVKCCNCRGDHKAYSLQCSYKAAAKAKARAFSEWFKKQWEAASGPTQDQATEPSTLKRKAPPAEPTQRDVRYKGRPLGTTATAIAGRKQASKLHFPPTQEKEDTQGETGTPQEAMDIDPIELLSQVSHE